MIVGGEWPGGPLHDVPWQGAHTAAEGVGATRSATQTTWCGSTPLSTGARETEASLVRAIGVQRQPAAQTDGSPERSSCLGERDSADARVARQHAERHADGCDFWDRATDFEGASEQPKSPLLQKSLNPPSEQRQPP